MDQRVSGSRKASTETVSFNGMRLRFIRFLGPKKPAAEFTFAAGLNVLYGASDTGKTFLIEAIDFMLGAGDDLKDIPERQGYDRILLGLTTNGNKDFTLVRSAQGGNFIRYDGLHKDIAPKTANGVKLNAKHSSKNTTNLSRWLLQQIGLDEKQILWSKESGETHSLGFRALAHLCVILASPIAKSTSPIESGQYLEKTRDYGVFKLVLTGVDDSSVVDELKPAKIPASPAALSPDALQEMLNAYETELQSLTEEPEELEEREKEINQNLERLQTTLHAMESHLSDTTSARKKVYSQYSDNLARNGEISELQARFRLLDQQYSTDLKRLMAIEETGQFFVLLTAMPCPLCGATTENQRHDSACDENVDSVTKAASAEIAKIKLLQKELNDTISALKGETTTLGAQREALEKELREMQKQIDAALSPEFAEARKTHSELIEKRSFIRAALSVYQRVIDTRNKVARIGAQVAEPEQEETPVNQYMPKAVLDEFSQQVQTILQAWHFPNATNTYFDEIKRDLVIGGKPRGSRGRGLCAITHSAFTIGLLGFCRTRQLSHPGFVILDSPLLAYKEPQGDDENIAGTDLKLRFYEHLIHFMGTEQLFIVENTEPPEHLIPSFHHEEFTHNVNIGRFGLFPPLTK